MWIPSIGIWMRPLRYSPAQNSPCPILLKLITTYTMAIPLPSLPRPNARATRVSRPVKACPVLNACFHTLIGAFLIQWNQSNHRPWVHKGHHSLEQALTFSMEITFLAWPAKTLRTALLISLDFAFQSIPLYVCHHLGLLFANTHHCP